MGIPELEVPTVLEIAAAPLVWEVDPEKNKVSLGPILSAEFEDCAEAPNAESFQQQEEDAKVQLWDSDCDTWKTNVTELYKYLLNLDITRSDITEVFRRCPQLLRIRSKDAIAAVDFIRNLGVDDASIGRVLLSEPILLTYKVKEHLEPAIEYILQTGVPRASIGVLTRLNANLLASAVEEKRRLDRTSKLFVEANKADQKLHYTWAMEKAQEARENQQRQQLGLPTTAAAPPLNVGNEEDSGKAEDSPAESNTSRILKGASTEKQKSKYLWAMQKAAEARKQAQR
eukprot:CAMPEP_0118935578 /NCGR_PEP_ID=MMETSP1169-20130426/15715_1 /TAXON_ID=36882 /ORGANISM="Pyramimonas obovata, Strain CCMP722" /LENGTH=285 /DNA_ID=CAMNT_0006878629 /DNA_START=489 /DNA_END=1346 /DNA_ORIENTATION=+